MDRVNKPKHYTSGNIECIEAMKASMSHEQFKGFLRGNVFKYLWRFEMKNHHEDLEKSSWYLNRLIMEVKHEKENK